PVSLLLSSTRRSRRSGRSGSTLRPRPARWALLIPPFTRQWQSLSSRHLLWLLLCAGGTVHRRRGCGPRLSLAVSFFCLLACPACGASRKALEKMPPLGYSSTEAGLSGEQQSLQPQDASHPRILRNLSHLRAHLLDHSPPRWRQHLYR